jgi:phospholipase/carboxylesterase
MTSRISSELLRAATGMSEPADSVRFNDDPAPSVTQDDLAATSLADSALTSTSDEVFVPANYEANYAYPLIVWLIPESGRGTLTSLMKRISERNFLGLAVPVTGEGLLEDRLFEAVTRVRRRRHNHTERIYVAGVDAEAMQALELGLARPEWFAGVVALSPRFAPRRRWLARYNELRGMRVFLSADDLDRECVAGVTGILRLLWSAGLSVQAVCHPPEDAIPGGVLREIDRWLIEAIEPCSAQVS